MDFIAENICNKAITVDATNMMSEVRDTMLKYNISRIVIKNTQKPIGMVTEKGISRFIYRETNDKPLDEIVVSKAMRTPLLYVDKDTDIKTCAKMMLDNDISSLVVNRSVAATTIKEGEEIDLEEEEDDDNTQKEEIYLFTKSDLVNLYSEYYKEKFQVKDFMTKQVFTMYPSNTLHTVLKILMKNRISRVIVTQEDKMVGIITAKDLMPITAFVEGERIQLVGKEDGVEEISSLAAIGHTMIARDIMKKPTTVKSTDDLAEAAKIMKDKKISGIPVVNPSNGELDGIITKTDIVKAIIA